MATDRKHVGVYLEQSLYDELERLRLLDKKKPLTMSKYAGRIIAEYVSRERWSTKRVELSDDEDFG